MIVLDQEAISTLKDMYVEWLKDEPEVVFRKPNKPTAVSLIRFLLTQHVCSLDNVRLIGSAWGLKCKESTYLQNIQHLQRKLRVRHMAGWQGVRQVKDRNKELDDTIKRMEEEIESKNYQCLKKTAKDLL
jgi:hypothetical protein